MDSIPYNNELPNSAFMSSKMVSKFQVMAVAVTVFGTE